MVKGPKSPVGHGIGKARAEQIRPHLEALYAQYHRADLIGTDPLVVALAHPEGINREVAGLIAAWFASGRARSIVEKSTEAISLLTQDGRDSIADVLRMGEYKLWLERLGDFRYRWVGPEALSASLAGLAAAIEDNGSILLAIQGSMETSHENVLEGLSKFVTRYEGVARKVFAEHSEGTPNYRALTWLWANPSRGAAAKRWMMWLRWFVRKDEVDPGGHTEIRPSDLIVPLDTHVFRLSRFMGLTKRANAGQKTALEITAALKMVCPEDPLRYDFALSRVGILGHCPGRKVKGLCEPCNLFTLCRA